MGLNTSSINLFNSIDFQMIKYIDQDSDKLQMSIKHTETVPETTEGKSAASMEFTTVETITTDSSNVIEDGAINRTVNLCGAVKIIEVRSLIKEWISSTPGKSFETSLPLYNPFPNKPLFLHVFCYSLLKTLWEKEKLLITSNFPFSHCVFFPFGKLSAIFIECEIVVCKIFQFGSV